MSRFQIPREAVYDTNGMPYGGALLYFYTTGTTTPKNTYSDSTLLIANANPVVADSAGRFGDIWLSQDVAYKVVLKDSSGNTIFTSDPVQSSTNLVDVQASAWRWGGTSTGAANVYAISVTPAITAYATGQEFVFVSHQASTGAATLNVNGVGAISIIRSDGTALSAGDVANGTVITVRYVSGSFRLLLNTNGIGLRNALLNGDMRVAQNGTTFSSPSTGTYTLDQWQVNYDGSGAFTVSRGDAGTVAGQTRYNLTWDQTGALAGCSFRIIQQRIESVNTMAGQSVIVSFNCQCSSGTVSITPTIVQIFGTGGSPSGNVTTSGTAISVDTTGTRYSQVFTVPSISGKTIGSNGDDCLQLQLSMPTTGTYTIKFWDVQLELGPVAAVFERRPIALETMMCQRYSVKYTSEYFCPAYSATELCQTLKFPVQMRAAPTMSTASFVASAGANGTAGISGATVNGARLFNSGTGWTVGSGITFTGLLTAQL